MSFRPSAQRLPIAIVSVLALASTAAAETLLYGVDAGVAESDNVTLVGTGKVSQTMAVADADFDFKQQSRRLDVDAKGNFSYIDYLQNAYGGELTGRFDGLAHVALVPEHLTWALQDNFGQAGLDPYTPMTPNNLENVNYVSTGPDLALRFSANNFVNFSARVARVQFDISPYTSNRFLGRFAWGLQLSAHSSVSLNADTERVLFENTVLNSDFERTNGFVRYELQGARTDFAADLGATTISQSGAATSGPLARIELARKISTAAKLTASAGRDLTDSSTSFSGLQGGAIGLVGFAPAPQTANNYTRTYATVGWEYKRNRTTVAVSGRWEKDSYATQPLLDATYGGGEFKVERKLTRALSAQVVGRLYKTDFAHTVVTPVNGSSKFNDELIAAALTWRHGRGLEIRMRFEHNARVATAFDSGYRENRAILTVGYRPNAQPDALQPDSDPGA
jgi:hypothetical protein